MKTEINQKKVHGANGRPPIQCAQVCVSVLIIGDNWRKLNRDGLINLTGHILDMVGRWCIGGHRD